MKLKLAGRRSFAILPFAAALLSVPAVAQAMEFRGLVKAGYDFGGDSLANVPAVSPSTVRKIRANEGAVFAAGLSILNDARNLGADATVGSKRQRKGGTIQDYEFTRTMVELLGFYSVPVDASGKSQIRFAAGPTVHFGTELEETGDLANKLTKFDNALGLVVQIDGVIGLGRSGRVSLSAGVRYTHINYVASGMPTVNGSGAGVFIGARFPVGL